MKKLLVILLAMLSIAAQAQEEKKSYVGGSLGVWHEKTKVEGEKLKTTSIEVLPELGHWVAERWAVGATFGFAQSVAKYQSMYWYNNETITNRAFTLNPYVRCEYFHKGIVGLFVDGEFGLGFIKQKELKESQITYEIGLRPGVSLQLSDRVHLHGHFGFLGVKGNKDDGINVGGLSLDATEFTLGMVWNY